ncbi:hypothetical protein DPMN_119135 [Dreissena polymorpha]|uniref:Uncharacterized protein n=1 Tax=Dreissena polymorpha TaxID=45954 RepID=A0A9D4JMF3_DREPO|nr:hypothetical protein DPMN_119135 [Dreissena polymorpha]
MCIGVFLYTAYVSDILKKKNVYIIPRHTVLASLLHPYGDPGRSEYDIDAGGTQ